MNFLLTYIIPINGLLLGALVLHERLNATVLGSLALVLLGVMLVNGTRRLVWRPSGRAAV